MGQELVETTWLAKSEMVSPGPRLTGKVCQLPSRSSDSDEYIHVSQGNVVVPTTAVRRRPQRGCITYDPNYCSAQTRDCNMGVRHHASGGELVRNKNRHGSCFQGIHVLTAGEVKWKSNRVLCDKSAYKDGMCDGVRVTLQQRDSVCLGPHGLRDVKVKCMVTIM